MKKVLIGTLFFALSANSFADTWQWYGNKNTKVVYETNDYYAYYERTIGENKLEGDIVIFEIQDNKHSGYFREYYKDSTCEGKTFIIFPQGENKKTTIEWIYDSGEQCSMLGQKRTETFQNTPPPSEEKPKGVFIKEVTTGGSGCPEDSQVRVSYFPSGNGDQLLLSGMGFKAQKGKNLPITDSRKFCMAAVQLEVPQGWEFSISDWSILGEASLTEKSASQISTFISFPLSSSDKKEVESTRRFYGPFEGNFEQSNTKALVQNTWSTCGKSQMVNLKVQAHVSGLLSSEGHINIFPNSKAILKWRKCL